MADYQIRVSADTKNATQQLVRVDKVADKATRPRQIKLSVPDLSKLEKQYKNIRSSTEVAANGIRAFYKVSKNVPVLSEYVQDVENLGQAAVKVAREGPATARAISENAKAANILKNSVKGANAGLMRMVTNLAKVGFAIYAVKEAVGILQAAYSAFFNNTIGREIQLQATILKTQTALASTSKVFVGGEEIVDPFKKITSLTSQIEDRIESIRERSLELAGVTSNDVIEVFGMVAQQISQIGGGLQDAEDLAIQFAAALGTFGIPLYQARQEIGSILRGDITMDSYLAKALGITNEDIALAKTRTGGVVKFLEDRLAAAVAGQSIAAMQFAGVTSNILEIGEEMGRVFGKEFLTPLLGGLTAVFNSLFSIYGVLKNIASTAGEGLSGLATALGGGAAEVFSGLQIDSSAIDGLADRIRSAFAQLRDDLMAVFEPFKTILTELLKQFALIGNGLTQLAKGFASISIENLKTIVRTFALLAQALTPTIAGFSKLLEVYGELLKVPMVQYLSQIATTFGILQALGVGAVTKLILLAVSLKGAWLPLVTFFKGLAAKIQAIFAGLAARIGQLFAQLSAAVTSFAASLTGTTPVMVQFRTQLEAIGVSLGKTSVKAQAAAGATQSFGAAAGFAAVGIKKLIAASAIFLAKFFAVSLVIAAVVEAFGRLSQAANDEANLSRAERYYARINVGLTDLDDNADAATRALRKFQAQAAADEVRKAAERLAELNEQIEKTQQLTGGGGRSARGAETRLQRLYDEQARLTKLINDADKAQQKDTAKELAEARANNEAKLAEERKKLGKQLADDEFRYRQQLAAKEVEAMRLRSSIEREQLSRQLADRLQGEEGISRTILEGLNRYIIQKKTAEDDIAARQRSVQIELANLDKQVADYRLKVEKQIYRLKTEGVKYESEAEKAKAAGQAPPGLPDVAVEDITMAGIEGAVSNLKALNRELDDLKSTLAGEQLITAFSNLLDAIQVPNDYTTVLEEFSAAARVQAQMGGTVSPQEELRLQYADRENRIKETALVIAAKIREDLLAGNLVREDAVALTDQLKQKLTDYLAGLARQELAQERLNELLRTEGILKANNASIDSAENELQAIQLQNRLRMEGMSNREIQNQLKLLRIEQRRQKAIADNPEKANELNDSFTKLRQAQLQLNASATNSPVIDLMSKWKQELNDTEAALASMAQTVASELSGAMAAAISGVVDGTTTIQEAFSQMFRNIAQAFIQMATQMIAKALVMKALGILTGAGGSGASTELGNTSSLFSTGAPDLGGAVGITGMATGGQIDSTKPYIIGERGPEVFMPGMTGTIMPSEIFEATRNAINGNAPAGGNTDAFEQNSLSLGNATSVTKERTMEREWMTASNEPVNVNYDATVINNVSYVTESQFQQGIKSAVAQSKSAVFSDLKNKPSARAGIGLR